MPSWAPLNEVADPTLSANTETAASGSAAFRRDSTSFSRGMNSPASLRKRGCASTWVFMVRRTNTAHQARASSRVACMGLLCVRRPVHLRRDPIAGLTGILVFRNRERFYEVAGYLRVHGVVVGNAVSRRRRNNTRHASGPLPLAASAVLRCVTLKSTRCRANWYGGTNVLLRYARHGTRTDSQSAANDAT